MWHRPSRESNRYSSNRAPQQHQVPHGHFTSQGHQFPSQGHQFPSQGLHHHAPLLVIPPVTNWNLIERTPQAPIIGHGTQHNSTITTILSSWCADLHLPPQLHPAHASNVFEWTPSPSAGQYVVVPGLLRHHTASGQPIQETEIFSTQPAIYRVISTASHFIQPVLNNTLVLRTVSRPLGGNVFPPDHELTIEFSTFTLKNVLILSSYGKSIIPEVQQLEQTLAAGSYSRLVSTAMQPDGSMLSTRAPSQYPGNIPTTQPLSETSQNHIPTTLPPSESANISAPGSHMPSSNLSYNNPSGPSVMAPSTTAANPPHEEHSASDTDSASSESTSDSDGNRSSSSSKRLVRDDRGNREKTLIKLTSTYDSTALHNGFAESRLTRNLGGKSTKELVIHAKDLTLLSEAELFKTVNDNFRSNPATNAEHAQLQGIPAFNDPRLLRMFFTIGFKRLDSPSFHVDPQGLLLAYFHPNFVVARDDPLKFFEPIDNSDSERLKIQRYVMEAILHVQFMFRSLMKRQFQKLFDPVIENLQSCFSPSFVQPIQFVVYEFQLLMANLTHDAIHVPTHEPWNSAHRGAKFTEIVTSQFLSPSSAQLYTLLTVRLAQSTSLFLPSDNTAKRNVTQRGDDTQGGRESKTRKTTKKRTSKKKSGATSPVPTPTTATPTINPPPMSPIQPIAPTTSGQPRSTRSSDYCRTHLLNVLGLTNSGGRLYVCERDACKTNTTLHSNVSVTASSSKAELEAFMATAISQTNWSGSFPAVVFQRNAIASFIASK